MATGGSCIACRGGQCDQHSLKRLVPHSSPSVVKDDKMLPVGCCDFGEAYAREARKRKWKYCPECGARRT